MRIVGNIIWHFPFFGFLNALFTFLWGGLLVITVVGAPVGLGLIQLSRMYLAPFTRTMVSKNDLQVEQNKYWKIFGVIVRIIYFPIGLILCIITIVQIAGLFISLVGIPVALVLAKALGTYFNPVGKVCVPRAVKEDMERGRKAEHAAERRKAEGGVSACNSEEWTKATSGIFTGVLILSLAGIANAFLSPILQTSMMFWGGGVLLIIVALATIAAVAGYILYVIGLGNFRKLLGDDDGLAVGKVRIGAILALIGAVPFLGIFTIAGAIFGIIGFSALKRSPSLPEEACEGAAKLFIAQIILIIGPVITFIPIAGGWIGAIILSAAFILMLTGWAKIKNTDVESLNQ